jgi:hypothetical protein
MVDLDLGIRVKTGAEINDRNHSINMTSIILATKNSQTLQKCLDAIFFNTNQNETSFKIILCNAGRPIKIDNCTGMPVIIEDVRNKCTCLVSQFNHGFSLVDDFFVTFPDDHFVQTSWLKFAHEDFEDNFPDGNGFLILNEMRRNGAMGELVLTRKSFINDFLDGVYFDSRFKHFRCSPELYDRAKQTGKTAYSARSMIQHRHKYNVNQDKPKYFKQDYDTYKRIVKERGY